MGIEPFLFLAVFVGGFVLQAFIALRDGGRERLEAGRWMEHLVRTWCTESGMTERGYMQYEGDFQGVSLTVYHRRFNSSEALRWVAAETTVRHRRVQRHLPIGEASTILVVHYADDDDGLLVAALPAVVPDPVRTNDPVLDQLVHVRADDAMLVDLRRPEVRDPVLELVGRHPLSFVTGRHVVLWLQGSTADLEGPAQLAVEVASALVGAREESVSPSSLAV